MQQISSLLILALAACLIGALILAVLLRTGWASRLAIDVPNQRSLHHAPVPRVGGWGIVPPTAILGMLFASEGWWIGAVALALALFSLIDDRQGLSARIRFAIHLAAGVVVVAMLAPIPGWLAFPIVIGVAWMINLYNFMDGADGLAGGMAAIGFGTFALSAAATEPALAVFASLAAGSTIGFLFFNFPPARLFLGDAGSVPLGFLAAALGYWGWHAGIWAFWFPLLVFSPFIADATVTLLRRLARGERFWEAHREHYYQRMVRMAAGKLRHRGMVLRWYGLMLAAACLAMWANTLPAVAAGAAIAAWLVMLGLLALRVDFLWRRQVQSGGTGATKGQQL